MKIFPRTIALFFLSLFWFAGIVAITTFGKPHFLNGHFELLVLVAIGGQLLLGFFMVLAFFSDLTLLPGVREEMKRQDDLDKTLQQDSAEKAIRDVVSKIEEERSQSLYRDRPKRKKPQLYIVK